MLMDVLKRTTLNVLDHGVLLFLVTPLIVLICYACWTVMDYILSYDPHDIVSLVAIFIQFLMLFYYEELRKVLSIKIRFLSSLLAVANALLSGILLICFWRYVWGMYEYYISYENFFFVVNLIQNSAILIAMKVFVNNLSAPFIARYKCHEELPESITYLGKKKSDGKLVYSWDCFLTMLVAVLIVFVWADMWHIMHFIIFPGDSHKTWLISMLVGYVLSIVCFILHPSIQSLAERFSNFKLIYNNIFSFVCIFASINLWRAYWMLYDILIDECLFISTILCVTSLLVLIIVGNANSLSFADLLSDKDPLEFQYDYVSSLFNKNNDSRQTAQNTSSEPTPPDLKHANV